LYWLFLSVPYNTFVASCDTTARGSEAGIKRHRFTVEEYHKMGEAGIFGEDDRVELTDGEVVKMTPIGRQHAETIEVHSGPGPGGYRTTTRYTRGERVESATLSDLAFDASEALPPQEPEAKEE
jgi:hypothetical protein